MLKWGEGVSAVWIQEIRYFHSCYSDKEDEAPEDVLCRWCDDVPRSYRQNTVTASELPSVPQMWSLSFPSGPLQVPGSLPALDMLPLLLRILCLIPASPSGPSLALCLFWGVFPGLCPGEGPLLGASTIPSGSPSQRGLFLFNRLILHALENSWGQDHDCLVIILSLSLGAILWFIMDIYFGPWFLAHNYQNAGNFLRNKINGRIFCYNIWYLVLSSWNGFGAINVRWVSCYS